MARSSKPKSLKVVLIDDHKLFREGLKTLLTEYGLTVVGVASDGASGVDRIRETPPDVVLLDIRMPDEDGLQVLKHLKCIVPDTPVAILTTSTEKRDFAEAVKYGADGYLLKDMPPDKLVEVLRTVAGGGKAIAPDMRSIYETIIKGEAPPAIPSLDNLTPREKETLDLLADGMSNKMIARNLGISDGTVKLHVKAILRKLSARSRVEAAIIAVEHQVRTPKRPMSNGA